MEGSKLDQYKSAIAKLTAKHNYKYGKPQLHILTPCYGGMVYVNFCNRIMKTMEVLSAAGISVLCEMMSNESLITRARNNLIAKSMSYDTMTHVLFIDADITWEPEDIIKLMLHDRELVGGIYPFKHYFLNWLTPEFLDNLDKRHEKYYNKSIGKREFLEQNLLKYNIIHKADNGGQITFQGDLIEIDSLPTGFMMIKKECIEKMMAAYPETKHDSDGDYLKPEHNKYLYALFDCYIKDGRYLSEDWAFCDRWKKIGGQVYADVAIALSHTGLCHHGGRLLSTFDIQVQSDKK